MVSALEMFGRQDVFGAMMLVCLAGSLWLAWCDDNEGSEWE